MKAIDAAEALGLLPRLRELAYPIDSVSFIADNGRVRRLDYGLVARRQDGALLSLMRPDLELALIESLPPSVQVHFGKRVETVQQAADAVTVTYADGSTDTADRMVGLYALRDGRVAMFGAHRVDDVSMPADRRAAVLEAYRGLGWLVPRALAHCQDGPELYYDQVAQIELSPWSSGRVVLAGDACQAVSLHAGQGASLAIAGGRLLALELLSSPSFRDAFDRYEKQWMPVAATKQAAGRRSAASFLPGSRFSLWMRRAGLRLLQLPGVGRLVGSRIVGKRAAER